MAACREARRLFRKESTNFKKSGQMNTKTLRTKITTCWNNGWMVDNIARIVGTDPDTVRTVLTDKGITDIR